MNALDIFAIFVMVLFLGLGIYHGFIKSISSLISIIAGLLLANKLSPYLAEILSYIHVPNSTGIVGFLIVFFFFFLVIKVLLHFIQKISSRSGLSVVDRILGGILGFVKGMIIMVFVITVIQFVLPQKSAILTKSRFRPWSNEIIVATKGIIPHDMCIYIYRGKK